LRYLVLSASSRQRYILSLVGEHAEAGKDQVECSDFQRRLAELQTLVRVEGCRPQKAANHLERQRRQRLSHAHIQDVTCIRR